MEEVNADREEHGKKPFEDEDNNNEPPKPSKPNKNTSKKKLARRKKMKTVTQSVTDPDSGLFVKGNHKRQFAYEAHTACDKHGYILETVVTPGNVHDSVAFDMIRLEAVNLDNWRLGLHVRDDQRKFVSDSSGILARAYAYRDSGSRAFVIHDDETPVGMAVYYGIENAYNFSRFFIDERYQEKGLKL